MDLSESGARLAGRACARAGTKDIVDASVVVEALERDWLVVTSDPDDLQRIAGALGGKIRVHRV